MLDETRRRRDADDFVVAACTKPTNLGKEKESSSKQTNKRKKRKDSWLCVQLFNETVFSYARRIVYGVVLSAPAYSFNIVFSSGRYTYCSLFEARKCLRGTNMARPLIFPSVLTSQLYISNFLDRSKSDLRKAVQKEQGLLILVLSGVYLHGYDY